MKWCKWCATHQPEANFHVRSGTRRVSMCRTCLSAKEKAQRAGTYVAPEVVTMWCLEGHPHEVPFRETVYPRRCPEHREAHARRPEVHRAAVLRKYRLTPEAYAALVASQDGKCGVCGTTDAERWVVDHDHRCCPGVTTCGECIRGVLCHKCNALLGMANDSTDILQAAAKYLDLHETLEGRK